MANLTLVVDDNVLKRARVRAVQEGTSVNAIVRQHLESYAGEDEANAALDRILALSGSTNSGSGPLGRTWTREDLYDRKSLR